MASVQLLGHARAFHNSEWRPVPMDKRGALLVYLAFYGDWLTRDDLAFTFWPDTNTSSAKANLRQILRRSKQLAFATGLETDHKRVRWQVETDVAAFQKAYRDGNWFASVDTYKGHLLEKFHLSDAEGFVAWLELERAELQEHWQHAVRECSRALAQTDRREMLLVQQLMAR